MQHSQRSLLAAGIVCAVAIRPVAAQPWPDDLEGALDVDRGRIGIEVQPMTKELREHFEAPADRGLLVSRVDPDRPAAKAGMVVGDVLLEGDGEPLLRPLDLTRIVTRTPRGEELELTAVRQGKTLTFRLLPDGDGMPWLDPDYWRDWAQKGMRMGSEELRRHLRELDKQLEELQRRLEKLEQQSEEPRGGETT